MHFIIYHWYVCAININWALSGTILLFIMVWSKSDIICWMKWYRNVEALSDITLELIDVTWGPGGGGKNVLNSKKNL